MFPENQKCFTLDKQTIKPTTPGENVNYFHPFHGKPKNYTCAVDYIISTKITRP